MTINLYQCGRNLRLYLQKLKLHKTGMNYKYLSSEFRWSTVKDWSEESRYQTHDREKARAIYEAITDPNHGVLQWLQQHW